MTFEHGQANTFYWFSGDEELKIDSGGDDDYDDMDDSMHNNSNTYSPSQQTQHCMQTSIVYKSI